MNRAGVESSCNAWRSWRIDWVREFSLTAVLAQTASSNSSLVTSAPGRSTRWRSTAKAFGCNGTGCAPRRSRPARKSRQNGAKTIESRGPTSAALTRDVPDVLLIRTASGNLVPQVKSRIQDSHRLAAALGIQKMFREPSGLGAPPVRISLCDEVQGNG